MKNLVTRGLAAVSLTLVLVGAGVAAGQAPDSPRRIPSGTCAEFMQSDRRGDVMVGMTRMMEMMGAMGERMGGQGGMRQPGGAHPVK